MHSHGSLRVAFVLVASVILFSGCGDIIRGSAKVLGADGIVDRPGQTDGTLGDKSSIIALVNGSHRTVEGQGSIVVVVVRQNPGDEAVTIDFRTREWASSRGATPGSDYRPTWGTLRWEPRDGTPRFRPSGGY